MTVADTANSDSDLNVTPEPNQGSARTEMAAMANHSVIHKLIQLITSRLALSVGAQALVSGFHFALNLVLLRLVTPYDYGVFAFAFVLAMFASAINNALISTPLTVYTPILKDPEERAQQEGLFSTLNLLLFCALVLCGVFYTLWSAMDNTVSLSVALFVAVYSARHFSRSAGYARMRPLVTASGDATYVGVGIVVMLLLALSVDKLSISHVLLALVVANLAAMLVERYRLHGANRKWFCFSSLQSYGTVWEQSRWALAGSLTTLFLAQAHSLIITATNGPNAYAPLAAGFVLFGPVRVALLTWQNMVKPEMAVALSESRHLAVRQQIRTTSFLMGGAVLLMGVVLMLLWPWINAFLYADQYADEPMAMIVTMWSVITLFAASYNAPAAALQAMRDFRVLAMASVYGAILSGVLVSLTLYFFEPETTLIGILAAEAFMAIYLTRILYARLHANS